MKTTGIVRCIDQLGRIVIPKEMCRSLKINAGDALEISMEGKKIVMLRHEDSCIFCGGTDRLKAYEGKLICTKCLGTLRDL